MALAASFSRLPRLGWRKAGLMQLRGETTSAKEEGGQSAGQSSEVSTVVKQGAEGSEPRELWRLDGHHPFQEVPQAWVESLSSVESEKVDLVQLHPDIWRVAPQLDIINKNLVWQRRYRNVTFLKALSRSELPGSGRKIWPQNAKMGRSRQKSVRSPLWIEGGIAHGIRGPQTDFYMLRDTTRVMGLCIALSLKLAQDDLVIIDDFNGLPRDKRRPPRDQPLTPTLTKLNTRLWRVSEARNWGYSCLFVDTSDVAPLQLARQCAVIPGFTPMPLYGLNVHSILKHETLVLSRRALDLLEQRLLNRIHMLGPKNVPFRYIDNKQTLQQEAEGELQAWVTRWARRSLQQTQEFHQLSLEEQEEQVKTKAHKYLETRQPPFI